MFHDLYLITFFIIFCIKNKDIENGKSKSQIADTISTNTLSSSQWGDLTGFSDKTIRIGFIKKVYLLLSIQLLFTFGIVLVFTLV